MKGHLRPGRTTGTWYVRVELGRDADGKRRQRLVTVRGTKAEAQRKLRELLTEVERGGLADGKITVRDLLERWLSACERRVGARTLHRYRQLVKQYIAPHLGALRAEQLRPAHIERALTAWARTRTDRQAGVLSARSVRHTFDTLKAACRWGVRMGILARNPAESVDPPRWEQREMRTLDAAGVAALLKAAGPELRVPIAVLVGTGLRRGELFGLRWTDVDLEEGRLMVRRSIEVINGKRREKPPKTARSLRTIALAPFVVAALRQQKREQLERRFVLGAGRDDAAYIFDRADGSPWHPDTFSWAFAELVRRSGLPRVRLHDLRHSHATIALAAGTDLKTISAALGHSTISVTANTYLHAVESLQRSHADRIGAALGDAFTDALAAEAGGSVQQRCNAAPSITKKPRRSAVLLVAPTGVEPVLPP